MHYFYLKVLFPTDTARADEQMNKNRYVTGLVRPECAESYF